MGSTEAHRLDDASRNVGTPLSADMPAPVITAMDLAFRTREKSSLGTFNEFISLLPFFASICHEVQLLGAQSYLTCIHSFCHMGYFEEPEGRSGPMHSSAQVDPPVVFPMSTPLA